MITKPTTLLLGAGASAHLGYPLGSGLVEEILASLVRCRQNRQTTTEQRSGIYDFARTDQGEDFYTSLHQGCFPSIDEFISYRRDHQSWGKLLITYVLKQYELKDTLFRRKVANGDRAAVVNWYQILGNSLREYSESDFRKNKLKIVTFNYDRSIDCFIHNIVMNSCLRDFRGAWDLVKETIEIVHLHGQLGEYPSEDYSPLDSFDVKWHQAADGIRVVHEMDDASTLPEFQKASQLLEEAEVVHIVGFSMGERNINNLSYFKKAFGTVKKSGINCAVGELVCDREYEDMRHRLRECNFLDSTNIHRLNSDGFYERFGFK